MRIKYEEMKGEFKRVLLALGFREDKAERCATLFAQNSRDGVYSHGLNRFLPFVELVKEGLVDIAAEPECVSKSGVIEHWDGKFGPGMYNATVAMDRAIALAKEHGVGLVTLKDTNHWMRGGSYGWQAAERGCIGICTTNTIANMPPWGGKDARLGNNPVVIAVPRQSGAHVVLDMAVSQYSYGALYEHKLKGKKLAVPGGYDEAGKLTDEPSAIYKSQRALPVGFWKGSGLSLVLDVLLAALSGGRTVKQVTDDVKERGVTQLFIAIYQEELHDRLCDEIIAYTKSSRPAEEGGRILYPGENTLAVRKENLEKGIPVHDEIWEKVRKL